MSVTGICLHGGGESMLALEQAFSENTGIRTMAGTLDVHNGDETHNYVCCHDLMAQVKK